MRLEFTDTPAAPNSWQPAVESPRIVGADATVTLTTSERSRFFRLRLQ